MTTRRITLAAGATVLAAGAIAVAVWKCHGTTPEPVAIDAPPPITKPRSTTTLVLTVTDHGTPVAARVLLSANKAPLRMGSLDVYNERQGGAACEIAPNVVGSWDGLILGRGLAEVPVGVDHCAPSPAIPYGEYDVLAWRGVEYELWRGHVDLRADRGKVALAIPLTRAWTPHGTLAADLHVHAKASPDSNMPNPQRVIAQVAAGIQVIGLTDHNVNGDLAAEIKELGYDNVVSIPANELSGDLAHVGVYPVVIDHKAPAGGSPAFETINPLPIDEFFHVARKLSPNGIVQLNHPRLRATALFDTFVWDGDSWPPPWPRMFDAVEVIAGHTAFNMPSDRRLDQCVHDYFTMVDHGFVVAPLGNSDTHDFNWILDGTARNYVFVDDPRPVPFDQAAFITAIKKRRVVATNGPWLDVEVASKQGGPTVGPGRGLRASGSVWVDIDVEHTAFVQVERLRITVGGKQRPELAKTLDIPAGPAPFHWAGKIELPRGSKDTWLAVTVEGDTPLPVEVTGSYHADHKRGVTPFAIASPILIDVDGDGRWKRGDAVLPIE